MRPLVEHGTPVLGAAASLQGEQGKRATYLDDEDALEEYLTTMGCENYRLKLDDGSELVDQPLKSACRSLSGFRQDIGRLGRRWDAQVVESALRAGAGQPGMLDDVDQLDQAQGAICQQIETLFPEICPVESFIDEVLSLATQALMKRGIRTRRSSVRTELRISAPATTGR